MLTIKGIIIGIGKIIPGVSGSLLAISMGIYQSLIDSINNFFTNIKENIKFLFKVAVGVLISVVILSNLILKCLNNFYLVTMFFFIGLIFGSMKDIKANVTKINKKIIFISFTIITLLGIININNDVTIYDPIVNFTFYIFVGFVDAFTMIVPGISGTATLMMIGAYNNLMETFSNTLNFSLFFENLKILLPYIIGLLLGVIVTVKIVSFLFNRYKDNTYNVIIGFTSSAIFLMGIRCLNTNYTFLELIMGFVTLILGILISKKINHMLSND